MSSPRSAAHAGTALLWRSWQFGVGQAVQLLRTLILARLLVPDDFGLMAIGLITVHTLLSLTGFGMEPALVQRPEAERSHYDVAWTFGVTRGLLVAAALVIAAPLIASLFDEPRAVPIIRVLAVQPLIHAAASIRLAELRRNLDFRPLALVHLSGIFVDAVVAIALAPRLGVWALVVAALSSAATVVCTSYVVAPGRPRFHFDRATLRPLFAFGRWIFVTSVFAVAGRWLLLMVIARRLGAAEVGIYYLSAKLAFMPRQISENVVGDVAFPLYARLATSRARASETFRTLLSGMALVMVPAYVLLICIAPGLVADVLGPRWAGSAPVIRVLSIAGAIALFGDAAVPMLKGLGRPSRVAILEAVKSAMLVAGVFFLTASFGLPGAASAWILALTASGIVALWFVVRELPAPLAGLGRPLAVVLIASAVGGGSALGIDRLLSGIAGLVLAVFVGGSVMAGIVWQAERRLGLGLRQRLATAFPGNRWLGVGS